jgi:poly(3-hydroxybutyrate) depolymerase
MMELMLSCRQLLVPARLAELRLAELLGAAAVLGGLVIGTAGCSSHETQIMDASKPADSCIYAEDGVCDEPRNCALGSDSIDCDRACASGYTPAIAAACDYDAPLPEPPLEDAGSHGSGGPGGNWESHILARHPNDAAQQIPRYYRVYVPPSYDPDKATPLLYVMGGFRVDNHSLAAYTELNRLADQQAIIVVYLQAHYLEYGNNGWVFQWYVFSNNWSPSDWPSNPDVDFIRELSAELKAKYNIDRSRIYTSGHSRGAAESVIVAFEAPDLIAGFLSESGFTGVNNYQARIRELNPARKVSGVLVHGVADTDVPVTESDGTAQALFDSGHVQGEHFEYYRLEGVTHQWQPQYNAQAWAFLSYRPLPLEMAAP